MRSAGIASVPQPRSGPGPTSRNARDCSWLRVEGRWSGTSRLVFCRADHDSHRGARFRPGFVGSYPIQEVFSRGRVHWAVHARASSSVNSRTAQSCRMRVEPSHHFSIIFPEPKKSPVSTRKGAELRTEMI
jgi:hypothetical protein